jgi:hypothetical protein
MVDDAGFEVGDTRARLDFNVAAVSSDPIGFQHRTHVCFSRLSSSMRNLQIVKTTIQDTNTKNVAIVLEYITNADVYKRT